jgi:hypothetical protein
MTTIYLIADQITSWGAGKTCDEAIAEAAQWLCDPESGQQGITAEQVESMIIDEHQSRNGESGVYVIKYKAEWPENAESMDGDSWLRHYYANTEE